jgi:hypothetical protein
MGRASNVSASVSEEIFAQRANSSPRSVDTLTRGPLSANLIDSSWLVRFGICSGYDQHGTAHQHGRGMPRSCSMHVGSRGKLPLAILRTQLGGSFSEFLGPVGILRHAEEECALDDPGWAVPSAPLKAYRTSSTRLDMPSLSKIRSR